MRKKQLVICMSISYIKETETKNEKKTVIGQKMKKDCDWLKKENCGW